MSKQNKLTPGQEEDKKERRKQLKAMDKAIFHNGPNRANPWAKKKAVGESMTFIQHLLENEPASSSASMVEAGDKIDKLFHATYQMLKQEHGQQGAANYILQNILPHLTQSFEELRSSEESDRGGFNNEENSYSYDNQKPEYEFNPNDFNADEFSQSEEEESKEPAHRDRREMIKPSLKQMKLRRNNSKRNVQLVRRSHKRMYGEPQFSDSSIKRT